MSAADFLKASQDALKNAKSASFELTVALKLDGNLENAGAGAAFLQGPLSLSLKGQAGMADAGEGKFDIHFALNFTGGSFSGEALSPDGKTAYIQMPTLLGPGWKSIDISRRVLVRPAPRRAPAAEPRPAEGARADPSKWLKNLEVHVGRTPTRSRPTSTSRARSPTSPRCRIRRSRQGSEAARRLRKRDQDGPRVRVFDHRRTCRARCRPSSRSTSRPPPEVCKRAHGARLKVDATFSDWNPTSR